MKKQRIPSPKAYARKLFGGKYTVVIETVVEDAAYASGRRTDREFVKEVKPRDFGDIAKRFGVAPKDFMIIVTHVRLLSQGLGEESEATEVGGPEAEGEATPPDFL